MENQEYQDTTFNERLNHPEEAKDFPEFNPEDLGKNIAIGVRRRLGSAENRHVISAVHSQREIFVFHPNGDKKVEKSFSGSERQTAKGGDSFTGDTASVLLALEIYKAASNKDRPTLITSTLSQKARELNIATLDSEKKLVNRPINMQIIDSIVRLKDKTELTFKDFLQRKNLWPNLTEASEEAIEKAWEEIDFSDLDFETKDAVLAAMKSWVSYHKAAGERLKVEEKVKKRGLAEQNGEEKAEFKEVSLVPKEKKTDIKESKALSIEVHTASPVFFPEIDVFTGTNFGTGCDFDTHIAFCQHLTEAGIRVHDTLTELACYSGDETHEGKLPKYPHVMQKIKEFKEYLKEKDIKPESYHVRTFNKKEGSKNFDKPPQSAGTKILPFRRKQGGENTSAIQMEVPRNIILDNERRALLAKATGSFFDTIN